MTLTDAQQLVNQVGGTQNAVSIVYDTIDPKDNRFQWWDTEQQDYALTRLSEHSVYTPMLEKAVQILKAV